ncbi:MAG: phosphodiester glycosidase family protein [Chitinophagaceae bacterium]|nr:phosphodiester glycosidase family protein [Chitinophagaceae bacterium]
MITAKRITFLLLSAFILFTHLSYSQLTWQNVDSLFQPLPSSVHVYKTTDPLDGKPNVAYYVEADLNDRRLVFTADTALNRRLTPSQFRTKEYDPERFYEHMNFPLVVVNCTFFSFATSQNLNAVVKDGRLVGYNIHSIAGKGKDTLTYRHPFGSAIGISKKRKADVAWLLTDSLLKLPFASQTPYMVLRDSVADPGYHYFKSNHPLTPEIAPLKFPFAKWKMQTAVGGGPVLLQNGEIRITNNEELKFAGKAINDKHPRTAMGYTKGGKLIILVIEGRRPGIAEGATLTQEAKMLKDIGCIEALNLDGGGSSCMLINGKETIKPSDKEGQRAVPAVFIVKSR